MAARRSYVEIISEFYPDILVQAIGDGFDYSLLQSSDILPTQADLDIKGLFLLRKDIWKEIQARRDYRKAAGIKITGNWYHSDDTSRIQQLALVMFGANMPADILWKTMQGTFIQMTPQLAMSIFQTIAGLDQAVFSKAEFHRQTMILSQDPVNYDYTVGWPQIYEESTERANLVAGGYQ